MRCGERTTDNCLHIPQGDAPGFMSDAMAIALKSLWPATCLNMVRSGHVTYGWENAKNEGERG